MCRAGSWLREVQQYELLARNLSSFRTAKAFISRVPTYKSVPRYSIDAAESVWVVERLKDRGR